jgi:hypothetical protein
MARDDFKPKVREIISKRAAYICSNPKCRRLTLAPSENNPEKSQLTGIAAHITAAASNGPRYDEDLTEEQRSSADNGIYVCSTCANLIDKNQGIDFPINLLKEWKTEHEKWIAKNLDKRFIEIAQDEVDKESLIRRMTSPTKSFAIEAVRELEARGWLRNGTLEGVNLSEADLRDVNLSGANLRKVNLSNANLQNTNLTNVNLEDSNLRNTNLKGAVFSGANLKNVDFTEAILTDAQELSDEQLAKVRALVGATMVSGKRYNGRFNLEEDLLAAGIRRMGMAAFYGVSQTNYEWGQKWNRIVYQSPSIPMMYTPELEEWGRLEENPEGIDENSPGSSYLPIWF